jgi:hypothetical protein
MRVMTARVVDGKIDLGDAKLEEGAAVAVLISETAEFHLSEADQDELEQAIAEIRQGQYTDGHELLRELRALASR